MTVTTGVDCAAVHFASSCSLCRRAATPVATTPRAQTAAPMPHSLSERLLLPSGMHFLQTNGRARRCGGAAAMDQAENDGNEHQRRESCNEKTADHRAAERRILLAAFAEAHCHRQHPDDHCKRGHQYRAEARDTRFESGTHGFTMFRKALARK